MVHGLNEGVSDLQGASPLPAGAVTRKKRISAQFGRRRTHNEQILVAPCGMILAHKTRLKEVSTVMCTKLADTRTNSLRIKFSQMKPS